MRPEQGLLDIRKALDLYANVRPAGFPSESLLAHSPLKESVAKGTNIIVVRELVKGLYYGERKEADLDTPGGDGEASDMMVYNRADVQRITRLAAYLELQSNPPMKVHSVDKANVLATSRLWRLTISTFRGLSQPRHSCTRTSNPRPAPSSRRRSTLVTLRP